MIAVRRLLLCPLLAVACSGSSGSSSDSSALTVETGDFDVAAGDAFECFYTSLVTDHEVSVVRAKAVQAKGGHHVTVYYADDYRAAEHHKCDDAEMTQWHQVAAAAGAEGASTTFSLPEGLAFKIPADKQIVVQSHYINTTGNSFTANDKITIELVDPSSVKAHANLFVAADLGFKIPPKASGYSRTTACTVQSDLEVATLFGHMHEMGAHYKLETVDDAGNSLSTLYERDWLPEYTSHTPEQRFSYEAPLLVKQGTRLRQTCTWNNIGDVEITHPREMCLGLLFYFPDDGMKECLMSQTP
jgi:hypothetical protein